MKEKIQRVKLCSPAFNMWSNVWMEMHFVAKYTFTQGLMILLYFRNLEVQEVAGPANADPNQDRFNLMAGGPRGNWAASDHERALRILHSFLRSCSADDVTLEEGSNFLEMLEQQRKEFKVCCKSQLREWKEDMKEYGAW